MTIQAMEKPTYLAKRIAGGFHVIEHWSGEQVCATSTIDWAHRLATLLNNDVTFGTASMFPPATHPANVATK